MSRSCMLVLAFHAYCSLLCCDALGDWQDVEEVEALSVYMNEVYIAPELVRNAASGN